MAPKRETLFELPARAAGVAAGRSPPSWACFEAGFFVRNLSYLKMASLKPSGGSGRFPEGRFRVADWLARGALPARAVLRLPLAGVTVYVIFFFFLLRSPLWLSLRARLFLRSCFSTRRVSALCREFLFAIEMPGDSRLKPSTQRAFGSRKKRPWNKKQQAAATSASPGPAVPDSLDPPGTSSTLPDDDTAGPSCSTNRISDRGTLRVDAVYYSSTEQAQRVERSAQAKSVLSEKSATQRKFDLLGVSADYQTADAGTQFVIVDLKVLNNFFAQAKCGTCGAGSLRLSKATDKEYGLAVKLLLVCENCDFEQKQFSSPRISEAVLFPNCLPGGALVSLAPVLTFTSKKVNP